jgi:hypothetical protein
MGRDLIPLREGETAALMRLANPEPVCLAFGTGGVALEADKSPWAVPILAEWRGLTFTDGAGI